MGSKRPASGNDGQRKKKFRMASGFIDPATSGIYATCARRKEKRAAEELKLYFEEKIEELYGDEIKKLAEEDNEANEVSEESEPKEELSIEEQIQQEVSELKKKANNNNLTKEEKKKELVQFIDLDCECVIFCKTRKPVNPEELVKKIMEELADPENTIKRTRYVQKLTPIMSSCSASLEQLNKLAEHVLGPRFHTEAAKEKGIKFAIEVTRRNFNTIPKMDIINSLVSYIGQNQTYKHKVDLKDYDKLVLVECFKNNIGISVVDRDYSKVYRKYNIQQIYESKFKDEDEKKTEQPDTVKN